MERLNRILSLISVAAASLLLVGIYTSSGKVKDAGRSFTESITIAVYLESSAPGEAIKEVGEFIDDMEGMYVKNFRDSKSIYKEMAANSRLSEQIEIIGEDFIFPPTYEAGISILDTENIDRMVKQLKKIKDVEHVQYSRAAALKAQYFLYKINKLHLILVITASIFALFFYIMGGYLQHLAEKQEYLILKLYRIDLTRRLTAGILNRIFYAFSLTLLWISLVYLLLNNTILDITFYSIKVAAGLCFASAFFTSVSYLFFYFALVRKYILNNRLRRP
ncbi:MAG: hypothetical protein PF545_06570 [Elusimicrobia bacterium]|jgi:hypothetical protein|nr:hypothetical protein [Elusimicrobiota bacterium]